MTTNALPSHAVLTSRRLASAGFSHGFFTRIGGVSPPPWDSLNFAGNTGDTVERVARNIASACNFLEVAADKLLLVSQVHGDRVLSVGNDARREATILQEADALATREPGLALGVRSADCATVLLANTTTRHVAAVHAGWRGVVGGVLSQAVITLRSLAEEGPIIGAVGPHIEACCFEVGPDVAEQLAGASNLGSAVVGPGIAGKPSANNNPRVNLRRIIEAQLSSLEVEVDHVLGCTFCDESRFFSYRRQGRVSGRMLSAIVG